MNKVKVIVYHAGYGCDTGCCGHVVEFVAEGSSFFFFTHPYSERNLQQWALELAQGVVTEQFGADHVADLDWENCIINDD